MATLKITQTKSRIGATERQRRNLDALGLHKIHQSVEHTDSKIILGMLEKVRHLVSIEQIQDAKAKKAAPKAKEEAPKSEEQAAEAAAPKAAKEAQAAEEKAPAKPKAAPKKPAEQKEDKE